MGRVAAGDKRFATQINDFLAESSRVGAATCAQMLI